MKLYYAPGACSLAPHIILRETGTGFELERVDLATGRTESGTEYRSINPRGQVPLLELDGGASLSEGAVIARYIADQAGAASLLPPAGDFARYRLEAWQNYVSTELHKSYTPLFSPDLEETAKEVLRGSLRKKYQWLDRELAGRDYLDGERFTVADAYLFTVTRWAAAVKLDLGGLPALDNYMLRIASRPAVKAALAAEG